MKKNTIKKFKRAFDAWLNDEEILCRYINEECHKDIGWMPLSENANFFSDKCIYIINDKHVEIRKAIAEGKVIKFYKIKEEVDDDPANDIYEWVELYNIDCNHIFVDDLSLYKISEKLVSRP